MSTNNNSKTGKNLGVSVDLDCSLSCLKPKIRSFLSCSFSSSASSHNNLAAAITTASTSTSAASSFSPPSQPCSDYNLNSLQYLLESEADGDSKPVKCFGRIDGEGVVVEKDSHDPYLDFRHSMLQMIIENEIYSRNDLRELLACFLQVNSPCYQGVIVHVFTEICNRVSSVGSSHPSPNDAHHRCYFKKLNYVNFRWLYV